MSICEVVVEGSEGSGEANRSHQKKKKQRDQQTSNNNRTFRPKLQNEALLLQNSASEMGVFDFSEMTCGAENAARRGGLRGCAGGK